MFQHTGQELADNLKVCMTAALRKYHEINGSLPDRVIVYRDGVGDGQVWRLNLIGSVSHLCSKAFCVVESPVEQCEQVGSVSRDLIKFSLQLPAVVEHEVPQIIESFKAQGAQYK